MSLPMIHLTPTTIKVVMDHEVQRDRRVRWARVYLVLFAIDRYNDGLIDGEELTQYLDQAYGGDDQTCLDLCSQEG